MRIYLLSLLLITSTFCVHAQKKLPFQGKLLNNSAAFTGSANFQFSIPSASWSETHNGVTVQDGYYSVVLGETTPLPDSLFLNSDEVDLNITVDAEPLSAVKLYAPFYDPTISNSELKMLDANGEDGLYLNGITGQFQSLDSDVTGSFIQSALAFSHFGPGNSDFNMYGLNTTGDGISRLAEYYTFDKDISFIDYTGGYRRSGLDLYDNEGNLLTVITSNRDEAGSDPSGATGVIILKAEGNKPNMEIGGKWWENHGLGFIQIFGNNDDGAGYWSSNIFMESVANGGNNGGALTLFNTANGGTKNASISASSFSGTGGGGIITLSDAGGTSQIDLDGGNGTITASTTHPSDRRLKKNVKSLDGSLDKVLRLQGVSYDWKNPNKKKGNIGFIAQEVQEVYPELVTKGRDGYLSVDYSSLVSALSEAIKELNAKVEKLEKRNKELVLKTEDMEDMKKDIDRLMKLMGQSRAATK